MNKKTSKAESVNTSETLITLIDEGETSDKVLEVNLASPSEALEVRNSILQYSPFVSDTVLKSSIYREELLNNAMLRDIMVANPHSAKSENLMQGIDLRLEPMPDYMKDEILEGIFLLSDKELMEARRDMNQCLYQYGFSRLLSSSLTDTIAIPVDTLMALLLADGSSASLLRQAWVLLENGDTISALNRMASIGTEINLSIAEIAEIEQQQALMQWLASNPLMDTTAMEPLNNFMQSHSTAVSSAARGLLIANGLFVYDEPYLNPDLTKSSEVRNPVKNSVKPFKSLLKVYPNPAQDFITIEYNTNNDKANVVVELSDESGRKVYRQQQVRQLEAIILDTRHYKSGNYFVTLVVDNKIANSAKFAIAR
ncbi:MAG: T9SS type A sorting domain-containing protein [Lentimicrobium sp.]|nr:T9SS type A sorting domain-containing protein [Lentimicrobium sp.]